MSAGERIMVLEASAMRSGLERALARLADQPDLAELVDHVGRAIIAHVISGVEPNDAGIVAVCDELERKTTVTLHRDGRWVVTIASKAQRRRGRGQLVAGSVWRISVSPTGAVEELKFADVSLEFSA